ncbi:MAG: MBL fold metallo-hydrolase [Magnetococcales bacterium]|nr:MBL fold metallo-hydrolase [Magnetococcales bacterium]
MNSIIEREESVRMENGRFLNTVPTPQGIETENIWSTLHSWFFDGKLRTPRVEIPVQRLDSPVVGDGATHVTWMGHSTLLIELDGKTVLLDPVFSSNASPFSWLPPRSFYPEMPISPEAIDHVDAVVISHDHYDHLDMHSIKALADKTDRFIVPLAVGGHLRRWGIAEEKITELGWWKSTTLDSITLTATPTRHFSGRSLMDKNRTLWAGWAIRGRDNTLYFGGDSGFFPGFKEIGERLGPFDLTMLECGAYDPAWPNIHMFPEQTAQAHIDLRGKALMPIHWSRFDLALHPWNASVERLETAARKQNLTIVTPRIGQRFAMNGELPATAWWREISDTPSP